MDTGPGWGLGRGIGRPENESLERSIRGGRWRQILWINARESHTHISYEIQFPILYLSFMMGSVWLKIGWPSHFWGWVWGLGELLFRLSLFLSVGQFLFQCPQFFVFVFILFCFAMSAIVWRQTGRSVRGLQVIPSQDAKCELLLLVSSFQRTG